MLRVLAVRESPAEKPYWVLGVAPGPPLQALTTWSVPLVTLTLPLHWMPVPDSVSAPAPIFVRLPLPLSGR